MVYGCNGYGWNMMGYGGSGLFMLLYLLILVGIIMALVLWIKKLWSETPPQPVKRKAKSKVMEEDKD